MNFHRIKTIGSIHAAAYGLLSAAAFFLLYRTAVLGQAVSFGAFFLLDGLSLFFVSVISVVGFGAALYSVSYIGNDVSAGRITHRQAVFYYLLFDLFLLFMFLVVTVNNMGFLWVSIEMTTLVSAFLVGFYRTKHSIEAAWKYIIICSVGIILALLGVIFFSYAMSIASGPKSLNWTDLAAYASRMDKNIVRIAFIFVIVGFGTKAGLAPMHTWLPDAHSQAVAPISALLSGVLLKTAVYAIIRFGLITNICLGNSVYFSKMMFLFGIVSLGIAAGLILVQKDLKRLLAYSSIEHIGVICVGLGIGGSLASLGVLLHIFNHAVTKSLMFFCAGSIVERYESHNMRMIRGVVNSMPFTGIFFLAGTFALTGFPPFSIFMSELLLIIAGFTKGHYFITAGLIFFLVTAFGGIVYHFASMAFGRQPHDMPKYSEPLSVKAVFIFMLFIALLMGVTMPWLIGDGLKAAAEVLKGI